MISHSYLRLCSYSLSLIHTTSTALHFYCPFLCCPTSLSFRMEPYPTLLHPPTSSLSDIDLTEMPVGCQRGIPPMFCWIWIHGASSLQAVGVHIPAIGRPILLCSLTDFILYSPFFPFLGPTFSHLSTNLPLPSLLLSKEPTSNYSFPINLSFVVSIPKFGVSETIS